MCVQVFFIRDGMKFVDLNHALKPNPVTGMTGQSLCLSLQMPTAALQHVQLVLASNERHAEALASAGIQEGWRILDFLAHHPEATHAVSACLSAFICGCCRICS